MPDLPHRAGIFVAVAQFAPRADPAANLATIGRLSRVAKARGADLVVFPEYSSCFEDPLGSTMLAAAEPLDGPFVRGLTDLAGELDLVVVAGLVERAEPSRFSNTLVAVGATGLLSTYRKQHLYDAFGATESAIVAAGPIVDAAVFAVRGVHVGMQTCYDIRFPEVTRRIADAGAELVVVPAEWVRGPLKEFHWRTLVTTRAIENTLYVAGAGQTPPIGVGGSLVVDPMGVALVSLGEVEDVAVAPVVPARVAEVRRTNPALALRRYRVVPRD